MKKHKIKKSVGLFYIMGGNIPGGNFQGGLFLGGNLPGRVWLMGIIRVENVRVGVFLRP